ncbi:hypothetical protein [Fodinibius salsisoli]|uniref:Outer membrane protein beta-barrel domain-containing protein n=1 Tax=Fodinibius salsisoli TaxID=2820877 RepID=A0ABT3PPC8_9BACT|nr:hypothetical protein [Fodinibius salsisoli]MCW9707700.1 hypothetical protein [Fodinibius salsisoli]
MRLLLSCATLILFASNLYAQEHEGILVSFQQKRAPNFELYNQSHSSITPWELEISAYGLEETPFELGAYLSDGYDSSITIAYGLNFAYLYPINDVQLLKAGLNAGRFKMKSFKDTVELGALLEDEYHESFKPFLEWQWDFTRYFSLFAQAGYRFIRTETGVVEKILSRYENGSIRSYRVDRDYDFYSSGFEFGAGISIRIH